MSIANARRFLDRADNDAHLQSQLQQTGASFATVARELGFEFTQDELHTEMSRRWRVAERRGNLDRFAFNPAGR